MYLLGGILYAAVLAGASPVNSIQRRAATCAVAGYDKTAAYTSYTSSATLALCGARCQADSKCLSFAIGSGACYLYTKTVSANVNSNSKSPYLFYDRDCFTVSTSTSSTKLSTSSSSSTKTSPTTTSTSKGSSTTTSSIKTSSSSFSSSSTSVSTSKLPSSTSTTAATPSNTAICGIAGYDKKTPTAYYTTTSSTYTTLSGCSALCKSQITCVSFAFGSSTCLLYTASLSNNLAVNSASPYKFYDLICIYPLSFTSSTATSTTSASITTSISSTSSRLTSSTIPTSSTSVISSSSSASSSSWSSITSSSASISSTTQSSQTSLSISYSSTISFSGSSSTSSTETLSNQGALTSSTTQSPSVASSSLPSSESVTTSSISFTSSGISTDTSASSTSTDYSSANSTPTSSTIQSSSVSLVDTTSTLQNTLDTSTGTLSSTQSLSSMMSGTVSSTISTTSISSDATSPSSSAMTTTLSTAITSTTSTLSPVTTSTSSSVNSASITSTTSQSSSTTLQTSSSTSSNPILWQPTPKAIWQIDYSNSINVTKLPANIQVIDVDLEAVSAKTVAALHARNVKVICYFSAGSYESYRSDWATSTFNKTTDMGKALSGWPNEWWVDIRKASVRSVMQKRIETAKAKGCDAVDPDNVDGYDAVMGFSLTVADYANYTKFMATTAASNGLSYALKNAPDLIPELLPYSQFSVQESCHAQGTCSLFQAFINAGKPIFNAEYPSSVKSISAATRNSLCGVTAPITTGFSTILKNKDLSEWTMNCDGTSWGDLGLNDPVDSG